MLQQPITSQYTSPQRTLSVQSTGNNPFALANLNTGSNVNNNTNNINTLRHSSAPISHSVTGSNNTVKRSSTNPFALDSISEKQPLQSQITGTNPFTNTRFATGSNTTPLTFNHTSNINGSSSESKRLTSTITGTNPFASADTTIPQSQLQQQHTLQQQPHQTLKPQATAGGLENLPTIPVFPETKRELAESQAKMNAAFQLQQEKNLLQQRQLQQQMLQQQQQPIQQFNTGFNAPMATGTGFLPQQNTQQAPQQQMMLQQQQTFQQQPFQQTQLPQQPQQQLQPMYTSYTGPNLI
ncbi:unnamed protein product [[Candida] boidinii]|nr:unnamed protein product [[Candida] boidinii]